MEFSILPVDQAATIPSTEPNTELENTPVPSICTTPSCTPLPLELHIDEDGCSALILNRSSVVVTSSRGFQYSELHTVDDSESVVSEVSHVKSISVSHTIKPPIQSVSTEEGSSSVLSPKSPSSVPERAVHDPVCRAKTDFKCSSLTPVSKTDSPVSASPTPKLKTTRPITAPRLSSPIPKNISPVTVPDVLSSVNLSNNAGQETCSKSPMPVPRLSSPVPKISSPVSMPNVSNSAFEPNHSGPETLSKNTGPVLQPRLSSPGTDPNSERVVKSPAVVTRKTYTFTGINSPTASPVQPAVVQSNSPTSPPSYKPGSEVINLTWPCREPLSDHALDRLLNPDSTRLSENQAPVSPVSGDEDRSWDEEDGFYPDFSRDGTLTPMTESSWMDECFTPSTCPGTPDATLVLPTPQPSAVERLSASGQVGQSL